MYIIVEFELYGYSRQNPIHWPVGHLRLKDGKAELVQAWRDATRFTLSEAQAIKDGYPKNDSRTYKIYEVCLDIDQQPYLEPVI
jgi:hypothetical protein